MFQARAVIQGGWKHSGASIDEHWEPARHSIDSAQLVERALKRQRLHVGSVPERTAELDHRLHFDRLSPEGNVPQPILLLWVYIKRRLDAQELERYERTVFARAAEFGHISVLQYMHEHHPDELYLAKLYVIARRNSNYEAEAWLNELER